MKPIFLLLPVVITLMSAEAMADCTNSNLLTNAGNSLNGKRIQATGGGDSWNEVHYGNPQGGTLCEVALGQGHPVDPSHVVGSWSASGNSVTYSYLALG